MSFFAELKRRNVVRVAIAYGVVSWLILQLTDTLMPILNLPDWVDGLIFLMLAVGFILALFLSWAYELTPDGVKREEDVDRTASITHSTGRKLDFAIIGVLSVALLYFAVDKAFWSETNPEAVDPAAASIADTESAPTTIAVLPFINLSDDSEQEYFSDGLAEELLNLLAKIPELRVTSRTSAFSFKGKDFTIAEVGERLNVDHVLEGSVRRSGDTIRITAQLIEVATDTHEWSETWDRKFEDIFAIQDEIAAHVVDALKLRLIGEVPQVTETTPDAYALFLQAQHLLRQTNRLSNLQAEALLKQSVEIDPNYAPAWERLGFSYFRGASLGNRNPVEVMPLAEEAVARALQLDSRNVSAHVWLAQKAFSFDYDFELAEKELRLAMEYGPGDSQVFGLAARMAYFEGKLEESIAFRERAHELDPLAGHIVSASRSYYHVGRVEEALQFSAERAALRPFGDRSFSNWARILIWNGDYEGALTLLESEASDGHQTTARALAYHAMGEESRAIEELNKLLALGNRWTYEIAEVYAVLGNADEAFEWLDRAIDRRDGSLANLTVSPFFDNIRDDPRFRDVLERVGLKPDLLMSGSGDRSLN